MPCFVNDLRVAAGPGNSTTERIPRVDSGRAGRLPAAVKVAATAPATGVSS